MATLVDIIKKTEIFFRQKGISSPRLDTELLIGSVLNMTRIQLYMNFDLPLSNEELTKIRNVVRRRAQREPIAYILEEKDFYEHTFYVQPGVLCPRPDTETLVEAALALIPTDEEFFVADIGSGTGCIGLSLAMQRPELKLYATDTAPQAIQCTKENVRRLNLTSRVAVLQGTFLSPIPQNRPIDMIVSNPPYIPTQDIESLSPEVRVHEPALALDGGSDGLDCYRTLIEQAAERNPKYLLLEIGIGQANALFSMLQKGGFNPIESKPDLAGIERVIIAHRL